MTIGIEAQRLFRRKKHGMEIVALEIIRQLQKIDTTNKYIVLAKNDEDDQCIEATNNFSIHKIPDSSYPIWEQQKLPAIVNKIKPDLLHCTANTAPLFCKVPMVITIHDVIYMESVNFSGSSYQNFGNLYRRFIVPRVAKKAKLVITVSEYEKKVIADRLKLAEEKIRVVYNAVNPQFNVITDNDTLSRFKIQYKLPEKFILHFANTAPKKNTIGVLKAYSKYVASNKDSLPLVLTDCKREYITNWLNEIGDPTLINKIQVLDYVVFNDVPFLYNLATVFLYPSHRESFGMPVIEAMACGTPVITSNTSALPEIAGGAALLVDPANADEIFSGIERLLSDPLLYGNQKEKGFLNAARFTWKEAAEKTLSIYKELSVT
ncbi:glycosyltransferase family 4 protein [Ferruginibacter albus]|uniref:glycosyltransferase family 4 protein n=1 Tax=Ferruginibacter albus TaxID=2875540 RepID=UPI001CC618AA|nr:glycosyltransferase family 1 protein [Ferruginibacter albus]UAY52938.1 glycosyltransferase family 4 protein [Ferruginibacter albus]